MNKKNQLMYNLNTINIAYKKMRQSMQEDGFEGVMRSWEGNREELEVKQREQIATIDYYKENVKSTVEEEFSDHRIKEYGKSQTLKEGYFNRMRIHVHRKEKVTKWVDLPSYQVTDNRVASDLRNIQSSLDRRKEFKTAMAKRRLVDSSEKSVKFKAASSPKVRKESKLFVSKGASKDKSEKNIRISPKAQMKPIIQIQKQKGERKENPSNLSKLDKLLNEVTFKAQIKSEIAEKVKDKKRNLSDQASNIRRRLAKIQLKRYVIPFRLGVSSFKNRTIDKKQPPQESEQQQKKLENDFKAWDYVDIFTSKNGIQDYANEKTIQPENQAINKRDFSVKKKKIHSRNFPVKDQVQY